MKSRASRNTIINQDIKQFKNQHPEYAINPASEILFSLSLLKNKSIWQERYQRFVTEMVYDNSIILHYKDALNMLEDLSADILIN